MSAVAIQVPRHTVRTRVDNSTLAIVALGSCGFVVALLQTMVVPLVPQVPALFSVSPSSATWLITATLVSGAVSAPVLGRLGDMYGKRRMLLVSVWFILASSVLAAMAPNFVVLLVARALQGVSFGIIALGMSLMRDVLPAHRVASGVGLMSSSLGIGAAAGPPLTGLVAEHTSWRLLFVAVAGGALVLALLVPRFVIESRVRTGGPFDVVGALGLGTALVCLLLGISKGTAWGWTSVSTLSMLVVAVVVLVIWGRHQLRSGCPLVDLRISARPAVLWTNIATVLLGFSIFATVSMATQVLQAPTATGYGFGLSMMAAGVMLLPIGGAMVVFSSVSAAISRRRGPRVTVVLGSALLVLGNVGFALLPGSLWLVIATATLGSIGAALAYSALPLLIMSAVPETETAAANSINTLMRQIGTSTVTAVLAAVGAALVTQVDGHVIPAGSAYSLCFSAAAVAGLGALVIAAFTPAPAGSE